MRTFLSGLGCLPVSAMIHVPRAQEVLDEAGGYAPGIDGARWDGYLGRTFPQLVWWAEVPAGAGICFPARAGIDLACRRHGARQLCRERASLR
jgi:hypothetical protein